MLSHPYAFSCTFIYKTLILPVSWYSMASQSWRLARSDTSGEHCHIQTAGVRSMIVHNRIGPVGGVYLAEGRPQGGVALDAGLQQCRALLHGQHHAARLVDP